MWVPKCKSCGTSCATWSKSCGTSYATWSKSCGTSYATWSKSALQESLHNPSLINRRTSVLFSNTVTEDHFRIDWNSRKRKSGGASRHSTSQPVSPLVSQSVSQPTMLTAYCLLLSTDYLCLTAYCLLLTAYCLLLTTHYSRLTTYCLLLTTYYLLLTT